MSDAKWFVLGIATIALLGALAILVVLPASQERYLGPPRGGEERPLHERVVVRSPRPGATVGRTFTVSGEAPGNWYFEASFPIDVRDASGNKVGQAIAQAKSDWMTVEQVAFEATVTVGGYTGPATLILIRDNPSGLPEHDDSLPIPIVIR